MPHEIAAAIQAGDIDTLTRLLATDAGVAQSRPDGQRTLLHIATDWPGHFPRVRETIALLVSHGADASAPALRMRHTETPLHWAASSDDVEALDALLDHGANIEAPGAVIGGGTPLADAVAFRNWRAARRLIERGARATLWQSAALGMLDRLEAHLASDPKPSAAEVTNAFWNACHGGQLPAAQLLAAHGADLRWVGHDGLTPIGAALRHGNAELVDWLRSRGL